MEPTCGPRLDGIAQSHNLGRQEMPSPQPGHGSAARHSHFPEPPQNKTFPDKVLALIPTGTAHLGWLRGRRRRPRAARSPGTPGRKGSAISSDPGQQGHRALITTTISSLMAHSVPALLGWGMGWGTQQEIGTKARDKDHSRSLVPAAASPEAEVPPDPAG